MTTKERMLLVSLLAIVAIGALAAAVSPSLVLIFVPLAALVCGLCILLVFWRPPVSPHAVRFRRFRLQFVLFLAFAYLSGFLVPVLSGVFLAPLFGWWVGLVIVLAYPPVVLWIPATVLLAERSEAATEGA